MTSCPGGCGYRRRLPEKMQRRRQILALPPVMQPGALMQNEEGVCRKNSEGVCRENREVLSGALFFSGFYGFR